MYYLKKNSKILGPFPLDKLQQMVAKGRILPEHLISEDQSLWVEASKIEELFSGLTTTGAAEEEFLPVTAVLPAPPQEEIKVKKSEENSSDVDSLQPPENLCQTKEGISSDDSNEEVRFLSVLWNPVYSLPVLCKRYEENGLKKKALLLLLFSFVSFYVSLLFATGFSRGLIFYLMLLPVSLLPAISFIALLPLFKKLFSEDENPAFGNILFVSGLALMPLSISCLLCSVLFITGLFAPVQIIILLIGLGIYSVSYAVLLLFNAFTRIFGINGGGTVFLVATVLLIASAVTGFFIKLII